MIKDTLLVPERRDFFNEKGIRRADPGMNDAKWKYSPSDCRICNTNRATTSASYSPQYRILMRFYETRSECRIVCAYRMKTSLFFLIEVSGIESVVHLGGLQAEEKGASRSVRRCVMMGSCSGSGSFTIQCVERGNHDHVHYGSFVQLFSYARRSVSIFCMGLIRRTRRY